MIANYYQKHGILVLVYSLISCSHSFVDGFHNKVVGSNVACRGCQTKKPVFRMITERHSICIILCFSCSAEPSVMRYRDLFLDKLGGAPKRTFKK